MYAISTDALSRPTFDETTTYTTRCAFFSVIILLCTAVLVLADFIAVCKFLHSLIRH